MVWFKVDDNLAFHRKTVMAGTAAMGLWVRAGSWSMHTLTDGFVPSHMVAALSDGQQELAKNLVKSGLWQQVDGGYIFHEWDQRQPSREEVEAKSQVRAEAGRKGGLKSGQVRGSRGSKTEANASSKNEQPAEAESSSSLNPDPARTDPNRTEEEQPLLPRSAQPKGTRIPSDFSVTHEMVIWAKENAPDVDGKFETEQFIDYWMSKSGKDATKVDWTRTWQTWMRNAQQRAPRRAGAPDRSPVDIARKQAITSCTNCDGAGWRIDPDKPQRGPISPAVRCDHTSWPQERLDRAWAS